MGIKKKVRAIRAMGWHVEYTSGSHLRCTHPDAAYPVITGSTSSDYWAWIKFQQDLRRSLREKKRCATT